MENKVSMLFPLLLFLFSITVQKTEAQNLVKNPGFEDYSGKVNKCCTPLNMSTYWNFELNKFAKQSELLENSHVWALRYARFFYHEPTSWRNRRMWSKYQAPMPRTGKGMAKITPEFYNYSENFKSGAKIQGQLHEVLEYGKLYCVRFYFYISPRSVARTSELAVFFYKEDEFPKTTFKDEINLKLEPHLTLSDSTLAIAGQWHSFTKTYKATGDELYFLIGTFKQGFSTLSHSNSIRDQNNENSGNEKPMRRLSKYEYANYFIDDVAVFEVSDESACVCVKQRMLLSYNLEMGRRNKGKFASKRDWEII